MCSARGKCRFCAVYDEGALLSVHVWTQTELQVAQADEEFMVRERKKAEDAYRRKVNSLFRQVRELTSAKLVIGGHLWGWQDRCS